jgi:tRNA dimethylallyltransferase
MTANKETDVENLRKEAIDLIKLHTKQYVKSQIAWINLKFLPECLSLGSKMPVYILDATDLSTWSENVLSPAISIAKGSPLVMTLTVAFLERQPLPSPISIFPKAEELLNPVRSNTPPDQWRHWTCDLCRDRQTGENFFVLAF